MQRDGNAASSACRSPWIYIFLGLSLDAGTAGVPVRSPPLSPFTTSTTVVLGDQGLLISRALPVLASAPVGGLLATRAGSRGIPPSCPSVSPRFGSLLGLSVVLCSGYPGCPVDAATAADRTQQPSTPLGGTHTSPRVTFVGPPRCYSAEITGATAHSTDTPYRGRSGLR